MSLPRYSTLDIQTEHYKGCCDDACTTGCVCCNCAYPPACRSACREHWGCLVVICLLLGIGALIGVVIWSSVLEDGEHEEYDYCVDNCDICELEDCFSVVCEKESSKCDVYYCKYTRQSYGTICSNGTCDAHGICI